MRDYEDPTDRYCVSVATASSVEAWFTAFEPTRTDYRYSYTTSVVPPELEMRVFKSVFPLGTIAPNDLRVLGPDDVDGRRLSGGAIAGVVVGCVVVLALFGVGIWLGRRWSARRRGQGQEAKEDARNDENGDSMKEVRNVDTVLALGKGELPSQSSKSERFAEMAGNGPVVELPADTESGRQ